MNFEDRVRRALRTDLPDVETDQMLDDVHRGVGRRRRRRTALAVAASVVVVAGIGGVAASLRGDERGTPEPLPATHTPSPTQRPLPPGAAQGAIDVSVASTDVVFRLTANLGCVACDTVWRRDSSAEGGWTRLHDFRARDAAALPFGPVTHLVMAANGRDGWAWGGQIFSTHDGGETWEAVTAGPGREDTEFGHQVALTRDFAWSLLRTGQGAEIWRSPLDTDDWSKVDVPDISGVSGMLTTSDRVGLETSDEGLGNPRIQSSQDGATWAQLGNPCPGENQVQTAGSTAFVLCPAGDGASVHRAVDLRRWERFGESSGAVTGVYPLADDRLLIVGEAGRATLITPDGTTTVDLGLAPGEDVYGSSSSGSTSFLRLSDDALVGSLLESTDGGLTWQVAG